MGTGFSQRTLAGCCRCWPAGHDRLPVRAPPPAPVRRQAHWLRPELVAQVAFAEWTDDGILRHPSFLGLRDDKDAADVTRDP